MKNILIIDLGQGEEQVALNFLNQNVQVRRVGCGGDIDQARSLIEACDGQVDAIGLEGLPASIQLGQARRPHTSGKDLCAAAKITPVVDGSGVRSGLERWGIILADRLQPGIFSQKHCLLVPGLNHEGLAQALSRHSSAIRYADPVVYFALPTFPGVGSRQTLDQVAGPTLDQLSDAPYRRIFPQPGEPGTKRAEKPFRWADVLAGDVGAIRRYAPEKLAHKTVVVNAANQEDLEDLRQRGVSIAVVLIPDVTGDEKRHGWGDAMVEALLVALRSDPEAPLTEDTYLDLIADLEWKPDIYYLQRRH